MSFILPTADSLVDYIQDFTGSNNAQEVRQCIFQAELMMRTLELPALRSNPLDPSSQALADNNSSVPIPPDMLKPILFYVQGTTAQQAQTGSSTGPWIVYDRVGDRQILTENLISQFYITPVNVPAVIRGRFSEVGDRYQFVPRLDEGSVVNLYYYRAWDFLFTPTQQIIADSGTLGSITGTGVSQATITGMSTTVGLDAGDEIVALPGTGTLGTGTAVISEILDLTSVSVVITGGTPLPGTIAEISRVSTVQTNPVLATFPEGYVYGTLHEYYIKRHSPEDAEAYRRKFQAAVVTVSDQNSEGKWSGGTVRLTSAFQPRRPRNYAFR